jgi:hypothetical protein
MGSKAEDVRRALGEAIKRCHQRKGIDRKGIVTELNARLNLPSRDYSGGLIKREITVAMLNELTRSPQPGRGASLPAEWVAELCDVLGDYGLALLLLPERLQKVLAVGELAIKSHGTLARALAELEKITEPPTRKKPGRGNGNMPRRKRV